MVPNCQFNKCGKVADSTTKLLEKWDSYDKSDSYKRNHTQDVWLCDKHRKEIYKLLQIESESEPNNE